MMGLGACQPRGAASGYEQTCAAWCRTRQRFAILVFMLFAAMPSARAAAQPNIVWIVAEDLSALIPPFADHTIKTPALTRLAAEGVRFTRVFSTSGVCAPSRAALATGMYPSHIGANHMRTGPWVVGGVGEAAIARAQQGMPDGVRPYEALPPAGVKMLSELLRQNGYYTTNRAKEDYQFRAPVTAWDDSSREAHWRNRPQPDQPFFAVINLGVTHEGQIWARADAPLQVPADLDVPVPPYLLDDATTRNDLRRLYSNVVEMDQQVASVIDALREDGVLDKTIVFWFTDHGGPMPRQKRLLYDSGLHVPMIVRFPGQAGAGSSDGQLISFVDFLPTVLSLAGIDTPGVVQGRAFLGPAAVGQRRYVHAAADRFDERTDAIRAVRDKRFKLLVNLRPEQGYYLPLSYREQMPAMAVLLAARDNGSLNDVQAQWFRSSKPAVELFDTATDPHEIINLAEDPAYRAKRDELYAEYVRWQGEIDDTGLRDERALFADIWPEGQQPTTAAPVFTRTDDGRIVITSATEGASIGYQLDDRDGVASGVAAAARKRAWRVYSGPIRLPAGMRLAATAHRLGYKPGKTRVYQSPGALQ